jgi:uncharacterized membrane protein YbhN (UPF0104 family)
MATMVVLVPWFLLGVINVWLLLRRLAFVPFATFSQIYATSWAASLLLPGQLGDATQIVLLRPYDVPIAASSAAYVTDKAISLGFLLLVAGAGIALYTPLPIWWLLGLVVIGTAIGVGALAAMWQLVPLSGDRPSAVRRAFSGVADHLSVFANEPQVLVVNLMITIVKWGLVAVSYSCAFRTFDVPIPASAAATIPAISSLVGYLPVTVGGIGTTEWTAVALFGRVGASGAVVLATYLFLRSVLIAVAAVIFGLGRHRTIALEGARCGS